MPSPVIWGQPPLNMCIHIIAMDFVLFRSLESTSIVTLLHDYVSFSNVDDIFQMFKGLRLPLKNCISPAPLKLKSDSWKDGFLWARTHTKKHPLIQTYLRLTLVSQQGLLPRTVWDDSGCLSERWVLRGDTWGLCLASDPVSLCGLVEPRHVRQLLEKHTTARLG